MAIQEVEEEGILLYYKYADMPNLEELFNFYNSNCQLLGLRGRVRLAPHGVNVTVGGKLSCLEQHIAALKSNTLFEGTDFKLASCPSPSNDQIVKECGFTSLSVRFVKELVTFSSRPLLKPPVISNAGRHLSAVEFNTFLQSAASVESISSSSRNKLLLLDARNVYETRIGRFQSPNVETLDPKIRQYSDLCTWIDNHSEQLRGTNVLMYCTGGIRCEMASAYIRSKGAGFENIFQLYGGIQRYLEQYPDGGYFKGKNFVFDHRVSVGCSNAIIVGKCLLCDSPFDDYSSRCRCSCCRMLVLVCYDCQEECNFYCFTLQEECNFSQCTLCDCSVCDFHVCSTLEENGAKYVCELCRKIGTMPLEGSSRNPSKSTMAELQENFELNSVTSVPVDGNSKHQTRLQSAELSEAVDIDPVTFHDHTISLRQLPCEQGSKPLRKLRMLCLHGFRQNASSFKGRTASLAKKLKNIVDLVFIDAPHELPFIYRPRPMGTTDCSMELSLGKSPPPLDECKKKFAWLVAPDHSSSFGEEWEMADEPFDPLQYKQQTDGFEVSLSHLKMIFNQMGPFDGVFGFSQGAAVAALLCAKHRKLSSDIDFKFAVLCSGFALNLEELEPGSIVCPSLHVFGNRQGKDRQIASQESTKLAGLFEKSLSVIITHESGHIIPTGPPYMERIKAFLLQFL